MQSGVGPLGRASGNKPSSSSSASQLRNDLVAEQSQQQVVRKPDGTDGFVGYEGGGSHGVIGIGSFVFPSGSLSQAQQPRVNQQRGSPIMHPVPQISQNMQSMLNNPAGIAAQVQAMQVWAREHNVDVSQHPNANLMAQLVQMMQSRMISQQKANESNHGSISLPNATSIQKDVSPPATHEQSHGNLSKDIPQQTNTENPRHTVSSSSVGEDPGSVANTNSMMMHQLNIHARDSLLRHQPSVVSGIGTLPMQLCQSSLNTSQGGTESLQGKNVQCLRKLNSSNSLSSDSSSFGGPGTFLPARIGTENPAARQLYGFTKQQQHVLKAQILAMRRLKRAESTLPQELLQSIAPPPLEEQLHQIFSCSISHAGHVQNYTKDFQNDNESRDRDTQSGCLPIRPRNSKEAFTTLEKNKSTIAIATNCNKNKCAPTIQNEAAPVVPAEGKDEQKPVPFSVKFGQEAERHTHTPHTNNNLLEDRGKDIRRLVAIPDLVNAHSQKIISPQVNDGNSKVYHGPLFDFPSFTRKHDSNVPSSAANNNDNLLLAYELKDILYKEAVQVISKRRTESLKKISDLLTKNLDRKRIRPDLALRLQIEEKKLHLIDFQAQLRDKVDQEQQDIMAMPDRPYKKFVRLCERQRVELTRQVQSSQKTFREKQLKLIFQWRKKLLEAHWAIRDARTSRNRGIAKYHEKMLKEFSKTKDDDRNKRMEALKNNDVERYRQILMEQQSSIPGEAAERYAVLSSFLSQTEEYLQKLGGKITAAKNQQEGDEAANAASAAAGAQGLTQEEVRAAAACAREEVIIRNQFSEMNAPRENSSVNKYYSLAHAITERVTRQPSMLRAGTLRDYQLVGLQWMLSLYNNKLNGILADEMGLGKTVQVMALIAHLMEFKGNNGPHLIIVPNAVLVNWKSEFRHWLPSVSCIFYVGTKDQRSKLFSQEVCALKFNVLVTTYEFIMFDRSKLSKVEWKYIIIDEAQRMKDRESVLARDLDRYRCQRRLLLTGTPLQNDLKELWSLLNLLLPEVFDNRKVFHDWFSKPFQKDAHSHNSEDDWLETEKKIIVIHRLHQILEPFMLRRRVEDVEGSLPPKVSFVLRCKMSAMQSAIYDWIKTTGTLRVDPEDELRRAQKSSIYQAKTYKTLNNKCMELRKTCNHPLLNYPYFNAFSKDFLVKSCGKLWMLDRVLIKLHRTGHRVLLFSTMTKLLDILEEYLQWRKLVYRRIDGTTSLDDRESAIVDFNSPGSDCFIFLLSIRAAGRGLNLQTADTVVIYDPDPNPKNEEQAVARAHRIGQKREVKVIYMEAVVDKISGHQKEDKYRNDGTIDSEDDLAGRDRYMGSIESLIRSNIQQYKIEMADEVINAGRFDQRTTHEERRTTLEAMLHDEERFQETVHDVPSLQEVNRMIARSKEEVELFDQMDEELDWAEEMISYEQVPEWIRASSRETNATVANLSKKHAKNAVFTGNILDSNEMGSDSSPKTGRRGRPKRKRIPNYAELDEEENGEYSDASSDESNLDSPKEDEAEVEDDDTNHTVATKLPSKYEAEYLPASNINYNYLKASGGVITNSLVRTGVSGSSSDDQSLIPMASPSISSQRLGSLSTFDARPGSISEKTSDYLKEGDSSASGGSRMDRQQSGGGTRHLDGENKLVLQPKLKRKRSLRVRPHHLMGKKKMILDQPSHWRSISLKRNTSKLGTSAKLGRSSSAEDNECSHDSLEHKASTSKVMLEPRMSDVIQRRCKNVISKLRRRIDGEGQQIVPLLIALWKKIERQGHMNVSGYVLSNLRIIDQRIDKFEYSSVMELISSVQHMFKGAIRYYGYSLEVRTEARKVHQLFFDILKIAFPDTDFRKALNDISFSALDDSSTSKGSGKQLHTSQTTRPELKNETESVHNQSLKPPSRISAVPISVHTKTRSKTQSKEPKLTGQLEELLTQSGELVICKKKRKDREKTLTQHQSTSTGPMSPPPIRSPTLSSSRDARSSQRSSSSGGDAGWANPVKRMRTDTGKRRPSHL